MSSSESPPSSPDKGPMVILVSSDKVPLVIEERAAMGSIVIKQALEFADELKLNIDSESPPTVNIENVDSKILEVVIEYLRRSLEGHSFAWEESSIRNHNIHMLIDIILAADFLNIPKLLGQSSRHALSWLKCYCS